ncbi:hypothetical protein CRG98_026393 [Punica granatum]|uniref:Aminotransferase-like plant mobile domain-containing protein n=1 Tax=Punica granatum TaxID=22663 RepID=A0A2I0JAA4_PUNGR|nr:hypothetical protein CRG98_026393 [Punica granatum]
MISGDSFSHVSVTRPHGKVDTPKLRYPKARMRAPTRFHIRVRMDRSHPCLRLNVIITLAADIMRLWRTFRLVDRAFLRLIIGDLTLLVDSPIDWTLLRIAISFWDTQHAVFNFQGTELAPTIEEYEALIQRPVPTRDIVVFVVKKFVASFRVLCATGESYQFDACHGFILLIFGTILFPHASDLIDEALTQVVLQVVRGHSYVETVLIETVRSLDYVRERNYTDWRQFMEDLTPAQFLWAARWNPGGPMAIGCPSVAESSDNWAAYRIFPPKRTALLTGSCDTSASLPERFLRVREARRLWGTRTIQQLFFPEHPIDEEQDFSTITACMAQFHPQGLAPVHQPRTAPFPQAPPVSIPDAESSAQAAARTELQSIKEERDRLRCELVDTRAELAEHKELERELAHARAHIANQDREIVRFRTTLDRVRAEKRKVPHP